MQSSTALMLREELHSIEEEIRKLEPIGQTLKYPLVISIPSKDGRHYAACSAELTLATLDSGERVIALNAGDTIIGECIEGWEQPDCKEVSKVLQIFNLSADT